MKLHRLSAVFAAMLCVFVLGGCGLFPEEEEELPPPLKAPAETTYTTTEVKRGEIVDSVSTAGTFCSTTAYDLSFEMRSGYVSEISVKSGDTVTQGQLLARLDTDDLELNIQKQRLAVERAQIALQMARTAPDATPASIRLAEIDCELQQIQLNELETELSKQCIYSPIDGVVTYVATQNIGSYVNARTLFVQVCDPAAVQVECTGDALSDTAIGKEVTVQLNKENYAGYVAATSAAMPELAVEKDKSFAWIQITDPLPENQFLLGKSVTVELVRDRKEDVLLVPRNVVSMYAGESYVLVLENGVKKERMIETGIRNATHIEVISGLEEGETVIIK